MVILDFCPGAKVSGKGGALAVKPVPDAPTSEIVMLLPPFGEALVRMTELDLLSPTATLPKSIEEAFSDRSAGAGPPSCDGPALPPPQETPNTVASTGTHKFLQ